MQLSDAIAAGARVLKTVGPTYQLVPVGGVEIPGDIPTAAQIGVLGRVPTLAEIRAFYFMNEFGMVFETDLEYWSRMAVIHKYKWSDVINKLKEYGK